MQVRVNWIAEAGVVHVDYVDARIDSQHAIDEWEGLLFPLLDEMRDAHGRVPIVVCIDNLYIAPAVADCYGKGLVARVTADYATCIARYGTNASVRSVIAVEAMRRKYSANIFDTREDAIAFATRAPCTVAARAS